jgi:hypothetical protein
LPVGIAGAAGPVEGIVSDAEWSGVESPAGARSDGTLAAAI